jgi:hypothetical protein
MAGTTSKLIAGLMGGAALITGGAWAVGIAGADETAGSLRDRFCATDAAGWQAERDARRTEYVADVADELGIDPAELESAMRTVALERLEEHLAEAVASGRMSQADADELRAAAADGELRTLLEERHPRLAGLRDRVRDRICES